MNIEDKLIYLYMNDSIAHNVISGYVSRYGKNYLHQTKPISKMIHEYKEEIMFSLMSMYKKMLDDNHKLILKILEESKTSIIIDKENFIKFSKKESKK